jgi:large subunit ribosomal protein L23
MEEAKTLKAYQVILHPLVTEKAVHGIETDNRLVFNVHKQANKKDIRDAVESLYEVKVDQVNITNDMKGRKKASVRLNKKFKANDLAIKLKII